MFFFTKTQFKIFTPLKCIKFDTDCHTKTHELKLMHFQEEMIHFFSKTRHCETKVLTKKLCSEVS